MMNYLLSGLMICFVGTFMAQTKQESATNGTSASVSVVSFETFCLQHATQLIISSNGKALTNITTVPNIQKSNPTYVDYGVSLKENEAQYFLIEGTSTLLKVESLFRLRLMYNALNK